MMNNNNNEELLDSIANELTCPICLEIFVDPRVLDCTHSFCFECLRDLPAVREGKHDVIRCPNCRAKTTVTADRSNLKKNHPLANISSTIREKVPSSSQSTISTTSPSQPYYPVQPSAPPLYPEIPPSAPPISYPPVASSSAPSPSSPSILSSILNPNNTGVLSSLINRILERRSPTRRSVPPDVPFYLPFSIDRAEVPELFSEWLSSRWFLPHDASSSIVLDDNFASLYVPFWAFAANTKTTYRGTISLPSAQDSATSSSTSSSSTSSSNQASVSRVISNTTTHSHPKIACLAASDNGSSGNSRSGLSTRHRNLVVQMSFDEIVRSATYFAPELNGAATNIASLEARDYRNVWIEQGERFIKESERARVQSILERDYAASSSNIIDLTVDVQFESIEHRLVYLPMHLGDYLYANDRYSFVMNAKNGSINGDRPYGMGWFGQLARSTYSYFSSMISGKGGEKSI